MDPLIPWLSAQLHHLIGERGQSELIVFALVLLLIWLLVTGRRIVVQ